MEVLPIILILVNVMIIVNVLTIINIIIISDLRNGGSPDNFDPCQCDDHHCCAQLSLISQRD